jgi:hypothetical protein
VINPSLVAVGATTWTGCVGCTTTVWTTTAGVCVAGTAVGGSTVGEGTSVGGWVASTTTVWTITTGVGEASTTVGVGTGGSVGVAIGALLQATKSAASKRITIFFILI